MNDKQSLKNFTQQNSSFIAIIGVFAAVTAYFSSENGNEINQIVSFFSLSIFIILCIEL